GVVLFECATGRPPFSARNVGELVRKHAVVNPPEAWQLNPAISPALSAVIAKLLSKDPDDRYQAGDDLIADLDRLGTLNASLRHGQEIALGISHQQSYTVAEAPLV